MSRIIKYRIWDNKNNQYWEPTYRADEGELEDITISMSGQIQIRGINGIKCLPLSQDQYIIELFSGLYDKKGNAIYSGDIIKHDHCDDLIYGNISPVDFSKGEFHLTLQYDLTQSSLSNCKTIWEYQGFKGNKAKSKLLKDITVIGNINENGDLL